jgi:MFS transporter, ACS family, allantoate permease
VCNFILLFTIRWLLDTENRRRDALQTECPVEEDGYVERTDSSGQIYRQKVDKGLLDLTDRQNESFRYSL